MKKNTQLILICALLLLLVLVDHVNATPLNSFTIFKVADESPKDGIPDDLITWLEPGFTGQVTGPGDAWFQEESFVEFDLRGQLLQQQAILNLRLFYSDDGDTGKTISISTYVGSGTPTMSVWGTGSSFGSYSLPPIPSPGAEFLLSIDMTNMFNSFVLGGNEFLGIRIHDAVSSGNTAQVALESGHGLLPQTFDLAPVPEPSTMLLLGTGLVCLAGFRRKFRR